MLGEKLKTKHIKTLLQLATPVTIFETRLKESIQHLLDEMLDGRQTLSANISNKKCMFHKQFNNTVPKKVRI